MSVIGRAEKGDAVNCNAVYHGTELNGLRADHRLVRTRWTHAGAWAGGGREGGVYGPPGVKPPAPLSFANSNPVQFVDSMHPLVNFDLVIRRPCLLSRKSMCCWRIHHSSARCDSCNQNVNGVIALVCHHCVRPQWTFIFMPSEREGFIWRGVFTEWEVFMSRVKYFCVYW